MRYMGWMDHDKKKSPSVKLTDAINHYTEKYERLPTVALVNPEQHAAITTPPLGVDVRPARHVALNTFYIGTEGR